jgi:hypothetical protein
MVQNMAETRRNLHQYLKGKQLYSTLYRVYTEVLHDLPAVLKESAAKGETAKITITEPSSNGEFCKQRKRNRKPPDNSDKESRSQQHPPWE